MQEIVQRVMLGYTKSIEKRNPFALMHNKKSNLLKTPFAFLLLLYTLCAFRPAMLWKPHFIFTTSYDYFKLLPRLRLAFLHVFYVWVLKERKTDFSLLDLKSEVHIILKLKVQYAHCIIRFSIIFNVPLEGINLANHGIGWDQILVLSIVYILQ